MKWLKRIAIVAGVLLVILAAVPFFLSLDDYIPRIEKEVSAKLGEPVKIRSLRAAALPLPHLTIDGIAVGKGGDVTIGRVTVTPDLFSLLAPTKIIQSIQIDELALNQKALDKIPAWTRPDGPKPAQPQVVVRSIRLDDAVLKLDKAALGPFDARVRLDAQGEPEDASIVTKDGKLKVSVKPGASGYLLEASARSWKPPLGPAILFDELAIKGVATPAGASLSQVSAKLYGGTANGKLSAGWKKGLQLKGDFNISQVELGALVPLLAPGRRVSGKLNAQPVFSANAPSAQQLVNVLQMQTPFDVQNGVIQGVDIEKAATNLISREATGGETRFDQLTGHLAMDGDDYRFTQLNVASGALAATGHVRISPEKELSGRITAEIKAAKLASVALNVSGTLDSPLLLPTGGTIAGAAAGTAILGPLGTAVGAKIGGWTERLFGKKEDAKK